MEKIENRFEIGQTVYDITRPDQKLIVSRCIHKVYYCKPAENRKCKDLVFFERDLKGDAVPNEK